MLRRKRPNIGADMNLCGPKIRHLREQHGKSLIDLSVELELSFGISLDRSAIGKLERGKRKLTDIELIAFADALGVGVGELLPESPTEALAELIRRR